MALDFPAGASSGQTFSSNGVTWSFDGDKWKVSTGTGIEPVFISSSTPTGVDGQLYWDSDESTAYIYYNDGNTAQWVPLVSTAPVTFDATAIVSGTLPVARGGTGTTSFDAGKIVEGNTEAEVVDTGSDGHFKVTTEGTERLRIDSSGNVGIGTTSPSAQLHSVVASGEAIRASASGAAQHVWSRYVGGSGNPADLKVGVDSSAGGIYGVGGGGVVWNAGNSPLGFGTNDTERMRIDSAGRLLLGLTSSIGGNSLLQVQGSGNRKAHFHQPDTGSSLVQFTNTTTGTGTTDGFEIALDGDEDGKIWLYESGNIKFGSSDTERMRIDSSGNVGIGTTSVSRALHVNSGATNEVARFESSDTEVTVEFKDITGTASLKCRNDYRFNNSSGELVRIDSSGNVGIGTTSPAEALHVVGEIVATGDITAFYSSDRRLKENIKNIPDAVEKVQQINGVSYSWKDKEIDGYFKREKEIGVIAQDVEEVLPEIVATRDDGYKAVRYDRLVALLIEAVKEQQQQIDELKAKLEG